MASILIVDDLSAVYEMLEAVIQPTGNKTVYAPDGEKALSLYKSEPFDLVLADISMQPMDGLTLLGRLKEYDPHCVVVMMTGYASTDTAIKALKCGAFDYIKKPFKIDEFLVTLDRALRFKELESKVPSAPSVAPRQEAGSEIETGILGESRKINRLRQQVEKLAGGHMPIVLQGESGTGRHSVARMLHRRRRGDDAPFVSVDCAFTTEAGFREGLIGEGGTGGNWIKEAVDGTLYLEHIENFPFSLQKELVSVLKNNINRFRLICSTDVDLEELVESGRFDYELFYRIAALPVFFPPLREHPEDIPLLLDSILREASNPAFKGNQIEFSEEALKAIRSYSWPGNLGEFRQVVSSLVNGTETRTISADQLPLRVRDRKDWPTLDEFLARHEKAYIETVLHACGNDSEEAAQILGCDPSRLSPMIER